MPNASAQPLLPADEEIRRLKQDLQSARKDLETFSFFVSHDLRAPLRAIAGFSQIVLRDSAGTLDAGAKDYLQRVVAATERLERQINDVLILSRVTQIQIQRVTVDLSAIAASVISELRQRDAQRKVEFTAVHGAIVQGDGQMLRIVLENMLGNAWKFTAPREAAKIEFGVDQVEGSRAYFVRDNGVGFNMAYVSRLFIPCQRLHSANDFPGAGIGLATVQRIVHRHGGRVWAEGAVDQGATFYFTIPD